MSDLNKVLLIGRLTADPSNAGGYCCLFVRTSTPDAVTHQVLVDGVKAKRCLEHLKAQRLVYIEGTLQDSGHIKATMVTFLGEKQ